MAQDVQSYAIPLHPGVLSQYIDANTAIGRTGDSSGFLLATTVNWLNGVTPGAGATLRVGPNPTGTLNVDYAEFTVSANNESNVINLAVAANTQILFRVISAGTPSGEDLHGSVQFEATSTLIGTSGDPVYTSLDQVKEAIGIPVSNTDRDNSIERDIDSVSRLFDSMATQTFFQQTRIEYHDGWALRNGITLKRIASEKEEDRLLGITVEENGTALVFGTDWTIDDYPANVIYRLRSGSSNGARFAVGERNVKVTYPTAFFEIPASISMACRFEVQRAQQANNYEEDASSSRIGVSSRTPAEGTTIVWTEDTLTQSTLMALAPYRNGLWGN